MKTIDVVTTYNVLGHIIVPGHRVRVAGIKIIAFGNCRLTTGVLHQILWMRIENVCRLRWSAVRVAPNEIRNHPAMNFNARSAVMALIDNLLQRIEVGGDGG